MLLCCRRPGVYRTVVAAADPSTVTSVVAGTEAYVAAAVVTVTANHDDIIVATQDHRLLRIVAGVVIASWTATAAIVDV